MIELLCIAGTLIFGFLAYRLRRRSRFWFGIGEIAVGFVHAGKVIHGQRGGEERKIRHDNPFFRRQRLGKKVVDMICEWVPPIQRTRKSISVCHARFKPLNRWRCTR